MSKSSSSIIPESCDYLVVGGGATGMSFVDTLLTHYKDDSAAKQPIRVVLVDPHTSPGGQWHDSYGFVRLHQPSTMYGVETEALEQGSNAQEKEEHRATRQEILDYYNRVCEKLQKQYDFHFVGGATFDLAQLKDKNDDTGGNKQAYKVHLKQKEHTISVTKRVVDARFLQPDIPAFVPPKFAFDANVIHCVPVNDLMKNNGTTTTTYQQYVIIGGGKTGMDAVMYLLTVAKISPSNILWIVPHEAWITARENMGSCMELLHTSLKLAKEKQQQQQQSNNTTLRQILESPNCLQNGFQEWHRLGKIYRLHNKGKDSNDDIPSKFKDATLSQDELNNLQQVPVLQNKGRVREILNDGTLVMQDNDHGTTTNVSLPWKDNDSSNVLFVHCSAGAFNYSQHQQIPPPPIFAPGVMTLRDVYGTPGFCFVGSILAKMECCTNLSDDEKNQYCLTPEPSREDANATANPLGPSDGDIAGLSKDHGFVQRLLNLKHWLAIPEIRPWLFTHRLFNLNHLNPEQVDTMVTEMEQVLKEGGII